MSWVFGQFVWLGAGDILWVNGNMAKKRKRKRRKNGDYDFYDYNNEAFTGAGVKMGDSQFVPPSLRLALGLSSDLESESSGADAEENGLGQR